MSHTHTWQLFGYVACRRDDNPCAKLSLEDAQRRLNAFDDLLAAAKGIVEWADATFGECEPDCECANCKLNAAIVKAEGAEVQS